jgi:hypothetical protein
MLVAEGDDHVRRANLRTGTAAHRGCVCGGGEQYSTATHDNGCNTDGSM